VLLTDIDGDPLGCTITPANEPGLRAAG